MTPRPALLVNDLRNGGAERLVVDLAVELATHDDVDPLVVLAAEHGELRSDLADADVPVASLGVDVATAAIPAAARALGRLVRARDVDLVHSHLSFSHVVGRLACAGGATPHVSTYHNVADHKSTTKRAAERVTRPLSDRVVCVSEGVRRSYPRATDATVIYNAIDVRAFAARVRRADPPTCAALDGWSTVLLNVARCVEQKRQRDLLDAVARLDDVHLVVVGDGPRRDALAARVRRRDLADRVTLTGYVEAVEPYYRVADVFVSASSREGLPTTHIEAMAAGLPVVSTDIPGVREVVDDGETGYLCPVGDPAGLASALRAVASNGGAELGARGARVAASRFDLGSIAADHRDLYRALVDPDAPDAP